MVLFVRQTERGKRRQKKKTLKKDKGMYATQKGRHA
jgi:hypothetical protein